MKGIQLRGAGVTPADRLAFRQAVQDSAAFPYLVNTLTDADGNTHQVTVQRIQGPGTHFNHRLTRTSLPTPEETS